MPGIATPPLETGWGLGGWGGEALSDKPGFWGIDRRQGGISLLRPGGAIAHQRMGAATPGRPAAGSATVGGTGQHAGNAGGGGRV